MPESLERESLPLDEVPTSVLLGRALDEARTLLRMELLHARQELQSELASAKRAALFGAIAAVELLVGLSVLLAALGGLIPLRAPWGMMLVAGVLLALAVGLALLARSALPRRPLASTRHRMSQGLLPRKQLQ
jgi:hypothetical protein